MKLLELLSKHLFMDDSELLSFAASSPHRYKVYSIAKRNSNERRVIAHPSRELKFVQRLIVPELSEHLPVHDSATAYIKGKSIKDNAAPHAGSKYLLKMDLKNFFPSILPSLFFKECELLGIELSDTDKELLEGFLFWKRKGAKKLVLSIGAPSSPLVSNFILYRFDEELEKLCKSQGIKYTRYADDLTFSTNRKGVLLGLPVVVRRVLTDMYSGQIKVNLKKTVLSSKAHNRHVTGITLNNNGELSIGRDAKRKLSASIHHFSLGILNNEQTLQLQGLLAHSAFIDSSLLNQMKKKYSDDVIEKIQTYIGRA